MLDVIAVGHGGGGGFCVCVCVCEREREREREGEVTEHIFHSSISTKKHEKSEQESNNNKQCWDSWLEVLETWCYLVTP